MSLRIHALQINYLNVIVLYLAHTCMCTKNRTNTYFLIVRPLFFFFLHPIAFKSYIPPTISHRKCF